MILIAHKFHLNDIPEFQKLAPCYKGWEVLQNPHDYPIEKFEILIVNGGEKVDNAYYEIFPNLKLILVCAVGFEVINLELARAKGIMVCNTPNINTEDVADLAMGLLIAGERNIIHADGLIRAGKWDEAIKLTPSFRLRGRKLGIYGMGAIGMAIAERARPFGLEILYHSRTKKPKLDYKYYDNLHNLATDCDILMVACALNEQTRYSINKNILQALGKDGVIINIARGGIIDENALLAALINKEILGAGLDVFDPEPTAGEKWLGLENTVLTPHFSGKTNAARQNALLISFDSISRYLKGENLLHRII